jgi:hypothetical protein
MFSLSRVFTRAWVTIAVLAALVALPAVVQGQDATPASAAVMTADDAVASVTDADGVLRFDVAEDATRFVFDPDLLHDDGMPAYGASFVTQGYIYPAGTLDASNGVNADGSPEFPDLVLGEWVCRGWFIGDGAHTTSGAWVVTTQIHSFGSSVGEATIVSDGYELSDMGMMAARAVTGGTGPFAGATGVGRQTLLGFNAVEGVNLQFEFDIPVDAA